MNNWKSYIKYHGGILVKFLMPDHFSHVRPLLVAKISLAGPFLVSQKWSVQTKFSSRISPARLFLPGPDTVNTHGIGIYRDHTRYRDIL